MITYDVGLDADGDLPAFCYAITGLDLVAQRLAIRLRTFLGEWILDPTQGLPYMRWLAQKAPDAAVIGAVVRREIETTPDAVRVDDYACTWDADAQRITITGTVITTYGDLAIDVSPLGTRANRNPGLSVIGRVTRIGP